MSLKNRYLFIALLFSMSSLIPSQPLLSPSWTEWLWSFFITSPEKSSFQKAIATSKARGEALNLYDFFTQKETSDSLKEPEKAARKFKQAIKFAADKNDSMKRFKDHPEKFLFGVSSSSYQYEGGLDSNNANAIFYSKNNLAVAGDAIDFWNKYKTDIQDMKAQLGINSFRLSIAWERVQPHQDAWDLSMLNKYVDIIKTLKENGIEPIVVLHHYTIPQWFAEIDGFEKAENISYFVEFAKKMYEALQEHVTYWSTFNAIEGYAFKGYYKLDGPPGDPKKKSLFMTEKVMYNMLKAHQQCYDAIKKLYKEKYHNNQNVPVPQIGIQKNIVLFDPFQNETTNFCEKYGSKFICSFSSLLNNTIFFKFFKPPVPSWLIRYFNLSKLDWIGLNIYSNMLMLYAAPQKETLEERQTENLNYRNYPEGIYRAVKIIYDGIARPLNIPIIITENGIATKNDLSGNEKRTRFFQRALYTIRKLIEEGYPIIGYTPWASHDNYEWPSKEQPNPYNRPYGMFAVNFDTSSPHYLERTLKKGAEYYRDFISTYFGK